MIAGLSRYGRFAVLLPLVAAGIAASGCSGTPDLASRQPLAGKVLVDGRPLGHGTIMFYPEEPSTKEHEAVISGGAIANGRFSIPGEKGLVPGKYRISVSSEKESKHEKPTDREASPGKAGPSAEEHIPEKFNSKTELEVEIEEGVIKELRIELEST